jgi:hypothetical protein
MSSWYRTLRAAMFEAHEVLGVGLRVVVGDQDRGVRDCVHGRVEQLERA